MTFLSLSPNLTLGDAKNNSLEGGGGDDRLLGLDGNDTLLGKDGNDYIEGGNGNDTLTGGSDEDRFVIDSDDGNDIITDFIPTDSPCPPGATCVHEGVPMDRIVLWDPGGQSINQVVGSVTASPEGDAVILYGLTTVTFVGIPPEDVAGRWFVPN
jgi:hypothetical protein